MFKFLLLHLLADGGDGIGGGGGSTPNPSDNSNGQKDEGSTPQIPPANQITTPPADEIQDPLAKAKADAEKWERLFKKAERDLEDTKKIATGAQTDLSKKMQADYEALRDEVKAETEKARLAIIEATRARIAHEHGLTADATALLTADDEENLKKQAERLANLISGKKGNTPNPTQNKGNPASGSSLTMDMVKQMSQSDVYNRLDEIIKILGTSGK